MLSAPSGGYAWSGFVSKVFGRARGQTGSSSWGSASVAGPRQTAQWIEPDGASEAARFGRRPCSGVDAREGRGSPVPVNFYEFLISGTALTPACLDLWALVVACPLEEAVPLSEEEHRKLEEMARALAVEDPKFVSALQGRTLRSTARMRSLVAGLVFVVGIAILLGAVMTGAGTVSVLLGAVGFVVMLSSAMVGLASWRGHQVHEEVPSSPDALFDFEDHPHRFEVIDGGRSAKAKRTRAPRQPRRPRQRGKQPKRGTFMQRIEQRWNHRREQGF